MSTSAADRVENGEDGSCGCKGVRYCALCVDSDRVKSLRVAPAQELNQFADWTKFVYCSYCKSAFDVTNSLHKTDADAVASSERLFNLAADCDHNASDDSCEPMVGLLLVPDFITPEEEESLMNKIDGVDWALSQSGRRKQDYGPRVNFKHKKVKYDRFLGMPDYADLVLGRMRTLFPEKLGQYQPFELCNLEYEPSRQSAIEFHQDDMWIWGNRLISVNLLSGSVMTLVEEQQRKMVFVPMPRRSLLCMADDVRYRWKHGILAKHIDVRRVALTMREPAPAFQCGGELYEKFGRDLIRIGNVRLPMS